MLGLAELTKFSMLVLYAVWPFLWLVRLILVTPRTQIVRRAVVGAAHGSLIVAISILVIDAGYRFEGVGVRLEQVRVRFRYTDQARRYGYSQATGQPEPALSDDVAVP